MEASQHADGAGAIGERAPPAASGVASERLARLLARGVALRAPAAREEADGAGGFYGRQAYWEARYAARASPHERDEWYFPEARVAALTERALRRARSPLALVSGCGRSLSTETLTTRGPSGACVIGVDFAVQGLAAMQARATCPARGAPLLCDYGGASVLALPLRPRCAALVFDKGTLDSLMNGRDPEAAVAAYAAEVCRVLAPDGTLLLVTHERASSRAALVKRAAAGALRVTDIVALAVGERAYSAIEFRPVVAALPDVPPAVVSSAAPAEEERE